LNAPPAVGLLPDGAAAGAFPPGAAPEAPLSAAAKAAAFAANNLVIKGIYYPEKRRKDKDKDNFSTM